MNVEAYTQVGAAFSIAYMLANPVLGIAAGPLRSTDRHVLCGWSMDGGERFPRLHGRLLGVLATARAFLGFGEGATFPGGFPRPPIVCRRTNRREESRFRIAGDRWERLSLRL